MDRKNMIGILNIIEKEVIVRVEKRIKKDINNVLTSITDDDMVDLKSALTNLSLICDWNVNNIKKYLFLSGILKFSNGKYTPNNIDTRYEKDRIYIKRYIIKELYKKDIFVSLNRSNQLDDEVEKTNENIDKLLNDCFILSNPNSQRKDGKFEEIRKAISLNKVNFESGLSK